MIYVCAVWPGLGLRCSPSRGKPAPTLAMLATLLIMRQRSTKRRVTGDLAGLAFCIAQARGLDMGLCSNDFISVTFGRYL